MTQTSPSDDFTLAVEKQQQGQFDEARVLYHRILSTHKNHYHALHLLGVIESTTGNQLLARRLMESSLWIAPDQADVLANLAHVLFHLGLFEETVARADRSLQLQDTHPRCHLVKARALTLLGRFALALESLDRVLQLDPVLADAWAERGLCLHNLNDLDAALEAYERALALKPDHVQALNNRGHALFSKKRMDEARQSVEGALRIAPRLADAHYHLGLIHEQEGRVADALICFQNTCQLNPSHLQAWVHQAFAMQKLRHLPQACIAVLDRALALQPNNAPALATRGGLFLRIRQAEDALRDYEIALKLDASNAKIQTDCGEALLLLGRTEQAKQAFRQALSLGGDPSYLHYALASLGDSELPAASPAKYVADLFDGYAHRFDEHLQTALKYQSPQLLASIVLNTTDQQDLNVLDLGCGTGLCGPLLRARARNIVGVDLSPNMLEKAGERGCYDQLFCNDMLSYLQSQTDRFDCIISADVFTYVGDLNAIFGACKAAIAPRGLFAFTVECTEVADVELRSSRRFAHSKNYVVNLASQHGFAVVAVETNVIRQESGTDLKGLLVMLQSP